MAQEVKKHYIIFNKIKKLLSIHFGLDILEFESGNHLTVGNSNVCISIDEEDLTIGHGLNHTHYHYKYENLHNAIDQFFNLLSRSKKITYYYKGEFLYKTKTEIENEVGDFKVLSSSLIWLFPYWKKSKKKIEFEQGLIDYNTIEADILEIKRFV